MTEYNTNTSVTPEAPAIVPGSPEYDLAHVQNWAANNPDRIPEQFGGDAGKFVESYKELQAKLTKTSQENAQLRAAPTEPVPEPAPTEPLESLTIPPETEEEEASPEASSEQWEGWGRELNENGALSEASRKTIRDLYKVPDSVIDSFVEGRQAQSRAQTEAAGNMVGGPEVLKGMINWASKNLPENERTALNTQLANPGWETVLLGLKSRYQSASPTAREPRSGPVGMPGSSSTGASPFNTPQEMMEAIRDPRYHSNKDGYRDMVMKRIGVSKKAR
jgi:hypothetical protein